MNKYEQKDKKDLELLKKMLAVQGFFTYDLEGKGIQVVPGRYSAVFVNMKKTWSHPEILFPLAKKMANLCKDCDCAIGIESGGSPYASLMAKDNKINLVLARKEASERGENFAGYVGEKEKLLAIVEDVVATGKSAEMGFSNIKNDNNRIRIVCVLSYGMDELIAKKYDIEVVSLYQIDDLLNLLDPDLNTKITPYIRAYQERLRGMIAAGKYTDKEYKS
ncbi:MAG: hypothetical protein LiPW15_186 [Parcubacteria group bacterium LiPW_15]|nr:MAG: hypothetical protein LiPW15_186 [Parcubacteria group bacterium LiPW_15]